MKQINDKVRLSVKSSVESTSVWRIVNNSIWRIVKQSVSNSVWNSVNRKLK